ncbi:MAG: DUF2155 domain-containing protein [Pseudomonadota bacterium]
MIGRCLVIGAALLGCFSTAAANPTWLHKDEAKLRALDKITGRSTDLVIKVGEPVVFGSLTVYLQVCYQTPPEEAPESAAFLRVNSNQPVETEDGVDPEPRIFSGWMFASSPGLSALEHPVYDVWVIECQAPELPTE